MNKAWLIVYDVYGDPSNYMIALDEIDALETYMSLVEEDIYYGFCYELQDNEWELTVEEIVLDWSLGESMWRVMEVPIIYGDSCC